MRKSAWLCVFALICAPQVLAVDEDTQLLDSEEARELEVDFHLQTFESCDAMQETLGEYIRNSIQNYQYPMRYMHTAKFSAMEDVALDSDDAGMSEAKSVGGAQAASDFSDTNVQVQ